MLLHACAPVGAGEIGIDADLTALSVEAVSFEAGRRGVFAIACTEAERLGFCPK
jgi:hypothetical protein